MASRINTRSLLSPQYNNLNNRMMPPTLQSRISEQLSQISASNPNPPKKRKIASACCIGTFDLLRGENKNMFYNANSSNRNLSTEELDQIINNQTSIPSFSDNSSYEKIPRSAQDLEINGAEDDDFLNLLKRMNDHDDENFFNTANDMVNSGNSLCHSTASVQNGESNDLTNAQVDPKDNIHSDFFVNRPSIVTLSDNMAAELATIATPSITDFRDSEKCEPNSSIPASQNTPKKRKRSSQNSRRTSTCFECHKTKMTQWYGNVNEICKSCYNKSRQITHTCTLCNLEKTASRWYGKKNNKICESCYKSCRITHTCTQCNLEKTASHWYGKENNKICKSCYDKSYQITHTYTCTQCNLEKTASQWYGKKNNKICKSCYNKSRRITDTCTLCNHEKSAYQWYDKDNKKICQTCYNRNRKLKK